MCVAKSYFLKVTVPRELLRRNRLKSSAISAGDKSTLATKRINPVTTLQLSGYTAMLAIQIHYVMMLYTVNMYDLLQ